MAFLSFTREGDKIFSRASQKGMISKRISNNNI